MADLLPPLKPIPIKERLSILFIEKGQLDVLDGAFVVVDKTGVRTHIPVGGVACLMLEIGTRISHAAVRLAAQVGSADAEAAYYSQSPEHALMAWLNQSASVISGAVQFKEP